MMQPSRQILIIDDEPGMRHMLRLVLEREGYGVKEAETGEQGLKLLAGGSYEAVLCDIRMPDLDGHAVLKKAAEAGNPTTIIMMSAYGNIDTAIACMKEGAYDYIAKPFKPDEVVLTLRKAEERLRLLRENDQLKRALQVQDSKRIVSRGRAMEAVLDLVRRVAVTNSPVLITGETGTGKELVARALHAQGKRKDAPFVAVNCSAISSSLLESELFGHVKGAFTGADRERQGLFGAADGGTLFLDEIGELPLDLQPKLLRVLQEGEVRRVGENQPRRVDVRVLAATARDLKEMVRAGSFRDDLFYRLAVMEIRVPPLREHPEDIPLLAEHFVTRIADREGRTVPAISSSFMEILTPYGWPGNIRELENFMEKSMIFCRGESLEPADLPWEVRRQERVAGHGLSLKGAYQRLEEEYIRKALASTGGNRTQAARILEISLRNLMYKLKEYGMDG